MPAAPVDSPPRPPVRPTAAARLTSALALCSAVLAALVVVRWRPLITLDAAVARTTHGWAVHEHGLTHAFRVLTDWAWDPLTMRLLCAVAAVWLVWRRSAWWTAVWLAGTCALAAVLQQGLKAAVDRPRPVWPDPVDSAHYAAFPSGHAMTAAVVCGLLLWLLRRGGAAGTPWGAAVALAVLSVAGAGVTRVWLGVHWPSDVLGGWLLGAAVAAGAVIVHNRWPAPPG
ncbi:phosphatase PAP2 family protein [Streptomyces carpinensis]|uniref:Phosphatase PAP2 family protein n=1 Tax=Streptomyces carpinensis TaxID=66369 RepID=A0ABV1WHE5_9ACTN|nr:phosphatase PAP2 family protein [Streptomyces carpinensis]